MSSINPSEDDILRAAMGDLDDDAGAIPVAPENNSTKSLQPDYDDEILRAAAGDLGDDVFVQTKSAQSVQQPKSQQQYQPSPQPRQQNNPPSQQTPQNQYNPSASKAKKKGKKWLGALVAVFAVFIIGIFAISLGGRHSSSSYTHVQSTNNSDNYIDYKKHDEIFEVFDSIESQYVDENGFVKDGKSEKLMNDIGAYLDNLKKNNEIAYVSWDSNFAYAELNDDTAVCFQPRILGELAGGGKTQIYTFEPYKSEMISFLTITFGRQTKNLIYHKYFDAAATNISKLNSYEFNKSNNIDNENVTIDDAKNFKKNSVIIWSGHGFKGEKTGVTGLCLSADYKEYSKKHPEDFKKHDNKPPKIATGTSGTVYLTYEFFDSEYGEHSLDNCMIYLGACYSAVDSDYCLAKLFREKGASCVFGSLDTIKYPYSAQMLDEISKQMIKGRTAGQAINSAYKKYGTCCQGDDKKPLLQLLGSKDYRLNTNKSKNTTTVANLLPDKPETTTQKPKQDWDNIPNVENPEDIRSDDGGSEYDRFIEKLCSSEWETVDEGDFTFYEFFDDGTVTIDDEFNVEYKKVSDKKIKFSLNGDYSADYTVTFKGDDELPYIKIVYDDGYTLEGPLLYRDDFD